MSELTRKAFSYAQPHYEAEQLAHGADIERAFRAGAVYQAKMDAELAKDACREHQGKFFELGVIIAMGIERSVE